MAKITRIKAKDPKEELKEAANAPKKAAKQPQSIEKPAKHEQTSAKPETKSEDEPPKNAQKTPKPQKKPFILIRPLVYFGRYVRDSWREIRQVRWPSRKATWKLFFAIIFYVALFVAIIMLLDALFTWLFEIVIG